MLQGERRFRILELLNTNKSITVKALCEALEASEATIRRDLTLLEAEGKLERTHGGAMLADMTPLDYEATFNQKESIEATHKMEISRTAFSMLEENETIMLDGGTTTYELAKLIGQSDLKINVITNSTIISQAIADNPNVTMIVIGGKVRLNTLATVGATAVAEVEKFNVDKSFIGVNGLTLSSGLTTPDVEEADIKRAILKAGRERCVLADHTKFKHVTMCQIAPLSMVDCIITDSDLEKSYVDAYKLNGIRIITA